MESIYLCAAKNRKGCQLSPSNCQNLLVIIQPRNKTKTKSITMVPFQNLETSKFCTKLKASPVQRTSSAPRRIKIKICQSFLHLQDSTSGSVKFGNRNAMQTMCLYISGRKWQPQLRTSSLPQGKRHR